MNNLIFSSHQRATFSLKLLETNQLSGDREDGKVGLQRIETFS